jgi:hypothetical protein
MNPQRTRCSTKARMKKSKRDLEMKHKNRSSQTHWKISLQRFEMGEARDVRERVGGVLQVRNGVWVVLLCLGREIGVSIYRWSSKLVVGQIFLPETSWTAPRAVEPPLAGLAACPPVWLADWRADWPTDWSSWPTPVEPPRGAVEPPLTAPSDLFASLTGRLQIRGQRGQRPTELPLRTSSTGLDHWV